MVLDQEEEFFFAAELVVEACGADPSGRGDVTDAGLVVALFGEDPTGALEDLNQLLVVAFLSVCHRHLIIDASLHYSDRQAT